MYRCWLLHLFFNYFIRNFIQLLLRTLFDMIALPNLRFFRFIQYLFSFYWVIFNTFLIKLFDWLLFFYDLHDRLFALFFLFCTVTFLTIAALEVLFGYFWNFFTKSRLDFGWYFLLYYAFILFFIIVCALCRQISLKFFLVFIDHVVDWLCWL